MKTALPEHPLPFSTPTLSIASSGLGQGARSRNLTADLLKLLHHEEELLPVLGGSGHWHNIPKPQDSSAPGIPNPT